MNLGRSGADSESVFRSFLNFKLSVTMPHRLDAVFMIIREPTHLVRAVSRRRRSAQARLPQ
jgi:hypothetical protein